MWDIFETKSLKIHLQLYNLNLELPFFWSMFEKMYGEQCLNRLVIMN